MTIQWFGLSDDPELTATIHGAVVLTGNTFQSFGSVDALREALSRARDHVAVLLKESMDYDVYAVSAELTRSFPFVSCILLVERSWLYPKRAMRACALDVVGLPFQDQELVQSVRFLEGVVKRRDERTRVRNPLGFSDSSMSSDMVLGERAVSAR